METGILSRSRKAPFPKKEQIKAWLLLSRPLFHSVGVAPYFLGVLAASRDGYQAAPGVVGLGAAAVVLIMLAAYYLGEYFDRPTDDINTGYNAFSGGTRVLQAAPFLAKKVLYAGCASTLAAAAIGLVLYCVFHLSLTGLVLGAAGLVCGVFYSTPPFQWAYRGVGELLIGFCYGWLTVNMGYHLVTNTFSPTINIISLPVILSITAVIIINEFPDWEADRTAGKHNLVVTFGREKIALVYALLTAGTVVAQGWGLLALKAPGMWLTGGVVPSLALALPGIGVALKKAYTRQKPLALTCALTIILNLWATGYFIAFYLLV
ncbi:MAG: prenyltransferase [Armatimonadetes bacterium]|nr:prenyltransferase [Armatimonadota bacterium]